ncbi:Hypothetical protein PENO1_058290 [Penicillium occitanis (nom. inval.)]|nr:hypothetical protein PENOC_108170 [Penicillium occitanis (nom. inval.)]PCG98427.1 Hypothetical protein PENO1_058290 [Penicillium occitanis (nom. inval.)]
MQSLLLPAPWFSKTHFGPHRFDIDPGRVSVHLRPPSSTGPKAGLRTFYSALPMSGIVPTGTQAPQSADTNAATTQREQQGGERTEISSSADQTRSNLPPRLPTLIPVEGPGVVSTQPLRFLSTEELLVNPTTQVPSISSTVSLSQVISGSPQLGLHGVPTSGAIRALPPRSTRRAKAHVASACVNYDVFYLEKRGRPPLKAEETPLRAVPSLDSSVTPREQYPAAPSARRPSHHKTSSREIRPVTDLQYSRPLEHGPAGLGGSISPLAASSGRWQPFASPQMLPSGHNQRLPSSVGPSPMSTINYAHNNPFTPYHMTAFPPPPGASDMPAVLNYSDRPPTTTPPTVSPQQYQQHFPPTLQSRISPQTPSRGLDVAPGPSSLGFREPYTEPGVRLPPILPSPPTFAAHTSTHPHQRSDSYPNIFTYQTLGTSPQQQHEPPLSSSSSQQFTRPQESPRSMFELRSPYPPASGPAAGSHERSPPYIQAQRPHSMIIPPTTTTASASPVYNERRRKSTANDSEENPQPAKRRRMAVDDIVND